MNPESGERNQRDYHGAQSMAELYEILKEDEGNKDMVKNIEEIVLARGDIEQGVHRRAAGMSIESQLKAVVDDPELVSKIMDLYWQEVPKE